MKPSRRTGALERIERIEEDWNRLVRGGGSSDLPPKLRHQIQALTGEAQALGLEGLSRVGAKLEELAACAERLEYRVPKDLDLLVMMAIRFVVLFTRSETGGHLDGVDLEGFVRQVDDVLGAATSATTPSAPAGASDREPAGAGGDRLSAAPRRRIGRAAVLAFVESVRATGSAREHLSEIWRILAGELTALGAASLAARVRGGAHHALERARELGKEVDIAVDLPDEVRVSPEVADALDTALRHLLESAVDHGRKGRGTVTIRCEDGAGEGELVLVIEDDGRGFHLGALRRRAPERLGAVRSALEAVGGAISLASTDGQGGSVRLRVPRADARLAVHSFTACGGLELELAVPSAWTVGPIEGNPLALDPIAALMVDAAPPAASDGFALRLTRGRFDLCWRAVGPVRQAFAERIGAPPDDQPVELVRIDGREALLLRPELSQS